MKISCEIFLFFLSFCEKWLGLYGYEENSAFYLYFIEIKNRKQRYISLFLNMNIKNISLYSHRNHKILFFKIIKDFFIIYTILRIAVTDIRNIHLDAI